jgi:hypothetical protein
MGFHDGFVRLPTFEPAPRPKFAFFALVLLLVAGCGPAATEGPRAVPRTCEITLGPSPGEVSLPAQTSPARTTGLVAQVVVPFSRVARELEPRVPTRLADERGHDIGVAGSLDLTVDRGPLVVSATERDLVVRTNLRGQARACASGRGCYATCAPEAVAEVHVPLALTESYGFAQPRVSVKITRGCRIAALGGLVQIDVTPTIEARLEPELRKVEHALAAQLPSLKPQAIRAYAELGRPRELPLGLGCAYVHPQGITQGPASVTGKAVSLRFRLEVSPEVRPRCDAPAPLFAPLLPKLAHDGAMPATDETEISELVPLSAFARAAEPTTPVELGAKVTRVAKAEARADADGLWLDATLEGEVCGPSRAHARPAWSSDALSLRLVDARPGSSDRDALTRAHLPGDALASFVGSHVSVTPKLTPRGLETGLPALARAAAAAGAEVTVEAQAVSVAPGEVRVLDADVRVGSRVRAAITVTVPDEAPKPARGATSHP